MIEAKGITKRRGQTLALENVSLSVPAGSIHGLIGAVGAGKSTLFEILVTLLRSDSGEATVGGYDIAREWRAVRRTVGYMPAVFSLYGDLTVAENLDLGAFLRRDKDGIASDMEYVFSLFPILKQRIGQAGGTLSGGEQQMLAVGRAIMARPKLLLLDEPSLGLAPIIIQQIFQIIQKVNSDGTTVFLVEQNANQALRIAHRGYVMENGCVTMEDSSANLLASEKVRTAYLGMEA